MVASFTRSGSRISLVHLILFFLVAYLYIHILLLQPSILSIYNDVEGSLSSLPLAGHHDNKESVEVLKRKVKRLEDMLFSYLSFGEDPFQSVKLTVKCNKSSNLKEFCYLPADQCHLGMNVCLDNFPPKQKINPTTADGDVADVVNNDETASNNNNNNNNKVLSEKTPCVVYDFGIREQPDFGVIMTTQFGCEVHAFDPSPVTKKWFASDKAKDLREGNAKYHLHDYGGGGINGNIQLREYNWGQVSIYRYPQRVINIEDCHSFGQCRFRQFGDQKVFPLPVRTVDSVMKELGHEYVDILKIDIEGSEYQLLETLILSGACRRIGQITLEWHHYDVDMRYGEGAIPTVNVLTKLLAEECGLYQFWIHSAGWPSNEKIYGEMGLTLRYNLAAFKRKT